MKNAQLREEITNKIIAAIENDDLPPWRKMWRNCPNSGWPTNVISRKPYSGVNPLLCQIAAMKHGFESKFWATYKQWSQLGGQVKKRPANIKSGQWGTKIVFAKPITKCKTNKDGEEVEDKFFILKTYTVFNVDQVESEQLDNFRAEHSTETRNEFEVLEEAEHAFAATGADVRHGGNRCYYSPADDYIQMPYKENFDAEYYESLAHEFVHWSLNERRLNWQPASSQRYAEEELVAEIGACFISSELGLPVTDNLQNHCSYLKSWLNQMKADSGFIFRASSAASKAADFVLGFSRQDEPSESADEDATVTESCS